MYEHNALGYWSGLALCLTKIRSSRARCPATALIIRGLSYSEHRYPVGLSFISWHRISRSMPEGWGWRLKTRTL